MGTLFRLLPPKSSASRSSAAANKMSNGAPILALSFMVMLMATAVSSMPGSFPGYHPPGPFPAPNFAHLLDFHLNSLQHLLQTEVQDSRGRDVELAMNLAQYDAPRITSHRNRRSAPSEEYGDGYGDDHHDDDYDEVTPFFNVPKFYAHYNNHYTPAPYSPMPYSPVPYGYGGGYGKGHGYNAYKPRYGKYYSPYSYNVGGY